MDQPLPNEEDLSLTAAPQQKPAEQPDQEDQPLIEARYKSLNISADAGDDEVLSAVLNAPADSLYGTELCMLPSGGLYYGWPDGAVRVRPMTQNSEKALATQRLVQSGEAIDQMFRTCCRFPDQFDPINMLLGDRMYLLYYLRGITHGNIYEFAITCPNEDCAATSVHSYDLNELAATIKRADPALGKEPFRVSLPYLSVVTNRDFWVSLRFLRAIHTNTMLAKRKQKISQVAHAGQANRNPLQRKQAQLRQKHEVDDTISENLEQVIVNVLGNDNPMVIHNLVERLHASDTAAIREWLRVNTPGIDATISIVCPECGGKSTVELPVTDTFFRPTQRPGV